LEHPSDACAEAAVSAESAAEHDPCRVDGVCQRRERLPARRRRSLDAVAVASVREDGFRLLEPVQPRQCEPARNRPDPPRAARRQADRTGGPVRSTGKPYGPAYGLPSTTRQTYPRDPATA